MAYSASIVCCPVGVAATRHTPIGLPHMSWLPVRPAPVHVTNRHAGAACWRLLFCLVLALPGLPSAHALSPDRALSQLRHDRWTADDGAPAQIFSLAQTPDGLLWLGSRQGLYRFDGVRFERITTAGGMLSVQALATGGTRVAVRLPRWRGFRR